MRRLAAERTEELCRPPVQPHSIATKHAAIGDPSEQQQ